MTATGREIVTLARYYGGETVEVDDCERDTATLMIENRPPEWAGYITRDQGDLVIVPVVGDYWHPANRMALEYAQANMA
jgi:hypothetical protein